MISYEHSLQIIRSIGLPVEPKSVHLGQLYGMTTSQEVHSPIDVPSFRNSSMDGFAVCASSIANATSEHPVELNVLRTIAAGDDPSIGEAGEICEIMTGAPVPEPYDAVVPVEDVTITYHVACILGNPYIECALDTAHISLLDRQGSHRPLRRIAGCRSDL